MGNPVVRSLLAFVAWLALFVAGKALIAEGIGHNRLFVFVFALLLLAAYYAVARRIEWRRPAELRANRAWLALLGAAVGLCLFCASAGLVALLGYYHFAGASFSQLVGGAIASFAAAVGEELLFRGFIFCFIERAAGTWIAVLVSAVLFGLAHALNRGATARDVLAIAVEAGVLLSAAYVYSRSLWLPIGIHFGWDFAGGAIFKNATILPGPDVITGGKAGIEGSLVAIVLCLAAGGALLVAAARSGRCYRSSVGRPASTQPR